MRYRAPRLLPILRSRHQADLLTEVLLHAGTEYSISQLSSRLSIPQATVSEEVRRLAEAGILAVRSVGRSRLVRADTNSKLVAPLTELLTLTFGPHVVVADEFAELTGVELVLIFGSWAALYHGAHRRPPNDVDVLVVGSPDRVAMHTAAERAESRLRRPVSPVVRSPAQWREATDPLVQEIKANPYLVVNETGSLGEDTHDAMAEGRGNNRADARGRQAAGTDGR